MNRSTRVERTLYRSLLRLARSFDKDPALKALICRNHGPPLPEPLDTLVARFLGSPAAHYYWPPPPGQPAPRVADAVRMAFQQPSGEASLESAFMGLRYLSGLLGVARRHQLLVEAVAPSVAGSRGEQRGQQQQHQEQQQQGWDPRAVAQNASAAADEPSSSSSGSGGGSDSGIPRLVGAPARGTLLLAHPCLAGNIFARSVVLVCRHESSGSYGLIVNKPLGSSLQHLHERLRQLQGGDATGAAGTAAGGPGGFLLGGGPGGVWEAATAGQGLAAAAAAAAAAADDIPAEKLQQLVDFLAWKQNLRGAAAAAAAAHSDAPEHDEYGNWLEAPYDEVPDNAWDSEEEGEGSEEEEEGPVILVAGDDGSGGVRVGVGAGAAAELGGGASGLPDVALLAHELGLALRNASGAETPSDEWGVSPIEDPAGVVDALRDALRRAGGGSVIMLDPRGQVWSHHLAPGAASDEESGSDTEQGFALEGSDTLTDDEPLSVASLVLSCLSPQDRLLLARQQQEALERQRLARKQQEGVEGGDAAGAAGSAGKARQLRQRVEEILATPLPLPAGQSQPQVLLEPLQAAGVAQSLFGIAGGSRSAGQQGSGASAAGVAGGGAGGDGQAHASNLSELMGLFKDSPLFRGGPVPGMQVLHQRPRLGGHLALPPWGPGVGLAPDEEAAAAAATAAAEGTTALAEPDGRVDCLEGGVLVGADLARAQDLVEEGYLQPSDVRVCFGDSGWSAGQLDAEVARGTWAVVSATPAFLDLFGPASNLSRQSEDVAPAASSSEEAASSSDEGTGSDSDSAPIRSRDAAAATSAAVLGYETEMWSRCLGALGPEYAALARVPKGVWEDLAELEV